MEIKITAKYVHLKDCKIEDAAVAGYFNGFSDDEAELERKVRQAFRIGVEALKDERLLTLIRRIEEEAGVRLDEIKSRVLGTDAVAAVDRGDDFEILAAKELRRMADILGDEVDHLGDSPGEVPNAKVGDIVVKINPRDTGGLDVKIVFECKTKKNYNKKDIKNELAAAMANRNAKAGVIVFDAESSPEEVGVFRNFYEGIACSADPASANYIALELAYKAARYEALSKIKTAAVKVKFDADKFRALVEKAAARLKEISNIKKNVTSIVKVAAGVNDSLDELNADIKGIISEMDGCAAVDK